MANPKPYYTKLLKKKKKNTLNNSNGSFGSCDFNIAIVVINRGTSPAILEGKPGPTEGEQRMSLLGSRKMFASIVLLSWRLSAQQFDYGILCIPSPSLQ